MPTTMTRERASDPVRSVDGIRPRMAKADLPSSDAVAPSDSIGLLAYAAVVRHFGSVKAASYELGVDPSQMRREIEAGNLARLTPSALVAVAAAVTEQFAPLSTPQARARHTLRTMRGLLDELAQAVELIA